MIDSYTQISPKMINKEIQSEWVDSVEVPFPLPPVPQSKVTSEPPSSQKKRPSSKKPPKKTFKKPIQKLQFSRNQSSSSLSIQSSPPQVSESEPSFISTQAPNKENEVLTTEVISLNREVSNLKNQLRKCRLILLIL